MPKAPERKPTRRQPKQQRAQETVGVVLEATIKVLGREGVDAVTTNRIAETAGVSIGSLYQYFPDKHAIFDALQELHAQRIRQVIARTLDTHATSPLEPLVLSLVDGLIDEHSADPPQLHELLAQQPPDGGGLRRALGALLASRQPEAGSRPSTTLFVLPSLMDVLVHEAVLARPSGLSLAAAKAAAGRAVLSCLHG
jgi:AcrR family transcriptional regulator